MADEEEGTTPSTLGPNIVLLPDGSFKNLDPITTSHIVVNEDGSDTLEND